MCGILYSLKETYESLDLKYLHQRGPESHSQEINEHGYFFHSNLNTIGKPTKQPLHNGKGILLYNGSTYNGSGINDAGWIGKNLDRNISNTINLIKELDGEYALVYVTDTHVVFCTDQFSSRNLWFYYSKSEKQITVCSLPNYVDEKHGTYWRVEDNNIYVINRNDFSLEILRNKEWDMSQNIDHYDRVFELFEKAVKKRYQPQISSVLVSSGIDSGAIDCAVNKLFNIDKDAVCDPMYEVIPVLEQRRKINNIKMLPLINSDDVLDVKKDLFNNVLALDALWDLPCVNPLINILRRHCMRNRKKVLILGTGGDELYNDYQGQGFKQGRTGYAWPEDLRLVWPYHNYHRRLSYNNLRPDIICGYFGVETRNPLLDIDLVQAWINTRVDLKNSGYKSWMVKYMQEAGYPYTFDKVHWYHEPDDRESWKEPYKIYDPAKR